MATFIKRPLMVTAHEFTEAKPSFVKTLEGKVKVKQGDMVITGIFRIASLRHSYPRPT